MSRIEHLDDVWSLFLPISGAMLPWCNGFQFLKIKIYIYITVEPQESLRLTLDGSNIPLTFALLVFQNFVEMRNIMSFVHQFQSYLFHPLNHCRQ